MMGEIGEGISRIFWVTADRLFVQSSIEYGGNANGTYKGGNMRN